MKNKLTAMHRKLVNFFSGFKTALEKGRDVYSVVAAAIIFYFLVVATDPLEIPAVTFFVHAGMAVSIVMALSYVVKKWLDFNQQLFSSFTGILRICSSSSKERSIRKLRFTLKMIFGLIKPLPAPIFFVLYCFSHQKRIGVLEIDVIFAIFGTVIWTFINRRNLVIKYNASLEYEADSAWAEIFAEEDDLAWLRANILIGRLAIPAILLILNLAIIWLIVTFII